MAKQQANKLVRTVFPKAFCEANGEVFEVIVPTAHINRRRGPSREVIGTGSTRRAAWMDAYHGNSLLIHAVADK